MTSPSPLLLLCILPWNGTLTNHIPIYHEATRNYSIHDAVIAAHMNESFTPHKHVIQALLISSFFFPVRKLRHKMFPPSLRDLCSPPIKKNVELNLRTDVSIQSGQEAPVWRKGSVSVILFSTYCPLFFVACVRLCVHICVSERGHAQTIACMADGNNLECQFLLVTLGQGLLLVAAELGILLSPSSLSLYECWNYSHVLSRPASFGCWGVKYSSPHLSNQRFISTEPSRQTSKYF